MLFFVKELINKSFFFKLKHPPTVQCIMLSERSGKVLIGIGYDLTGQTLASVRISNFAAVF